jgi:hypothetical protein
MAYTKILVSKVMELREDLGLIIEVNAGTNGKVNDLVLWLQYKDSNGAWAYKGSKGATGIRIPMSNGLDKFLMDNIKLSFDASTKYVATSKANTSIDVNSLDDVTKANLLQALLASAKASNASEPALSLDNLLNLIAPKEAGKAKGKKK